MSALPVLAETPRNAKPWCAMTVHFKSAPPEAAAEYIRLRGLTRENAVSEERLRDGPGEHGHAPVPDPGELRLLGAARELAFFYGLFQLPWCCHLA